MPIQNFSDGVPIEPSTTGVPSNDTDAGSVLCKIREVERLLESLVASWQGSPQVVQARCWHRMNYQKPIVLTPLDDRTEEPIEESVLVTGCDISQGGISFAHVELLPCRKAAISFAAESGLVESVVTRLTWCRFTREGRYRSGGQFLRIVKLPGRHALNWKTLRPA